MTWLRPYVSLWSWTVISRWWWVCWKWEAHQQVKVVNTAASVLTADQETPRCFTLYTYVLTPPTAESFQHVDLHLQYCVSSLLQLISWSDGCVLSDRKETPVESFCFSSFPSCFLSSRPLPLTFLCLLTLHLTSEHCSDTDVSVQWERHFIMRARAFKSCLPLTISDHWLRFGLTERCDWGNPLVGRPGVTEAQRERLRWSRPWVVWGGETWQKKDRHEKKERGKESREREFQLYHRCSLQLCWN